MNINEDRRALSVLLDEYIISFIKYSIVDITSFFCKNNVFFVKCIRFEVFNYERNFELSLVSRVFWFVGTIKLLFLVK